MFAEAKRAVDQVTEEVAKKCAALCWKEVSKIDIVDNRPILDVE